MPYVAPPTFVSGDFLLASELNTLSDDIEYLAGGVEAATFSAVQVTRTTDQSLASGVAEYVSFTAEALDFGGWWSTGTTITVPAGAIPAGYTTIGVIFFASGRFAANGTGARRISIHKNGASVGSWNLSAISGDSTAVYLSDLTTVAAGDTIKLEVYQTSGSSLNLTAALLSVVRIGAAS